MQPIHVIGAGLAGSEAAYQIARQGVPVLLHEMRPAKSDPAHKTGNFAELVCSNSLRAANVENAVGLLKEEMRRLGSLIIGEADIHQVPAGGALAVDRDGFAQGVTEAVRSLPLVTVIPGEVQDLSRLEGTVVIASGPLTSPALSAAIQKLLQEDYLYFFDAAAPIVTGESLDHTKVFKASRYDKGPAAYLNCPFYTKEEYLHFWQELVYAEMAPVHDFETGNVFEGCMPVEEMAARGEDTLRFGPLKPVGLVDPRTGKEAYAVVQLRQDNAAGTLFNLVGFQTHLKWPEQRRVFGLIPGLEKAEFVRYGVMHKNTYLHSPKLLDEHFQLRQAPRFYFAGQMTGVEGYVESAASGLMVGIHAAREALGLAPVSFPQETAHGALAHYISNPEVQEFQPMNINFGLLPPLAKKIRPKKLKNQMIAQRALDSLSELIGNLCLPR